MTIPAWPSIFQPTEHHAPFAEGELLSTNRIIRRVLADGNLHRVLDDGLPWRDDDRRAKVLSQLARCRQGALGARLYDCSGCGARRVTLNACGDRHCAACARQSRFVWQHEVLSWSLDCDYLHLVLTLPHELNALVAANPGRLLRLLLDVARQSVLRLARRLGGCVPGVILVLHTWGQRLNLHYHVHIVMTAGGQSLDGTRWIPLDQDTVAAQKVPLAAHFKKLFLRRLRRMLDREPPSGEPHSARSEAGEASEATPRPSSRKPLLYPPVLPDREAVDGMLEAVEAKAWVADIGTTPQKYRNRGERRRSLGYVGKYVAGLAIGDGRLIGYREGRVTFRAYDYRTDQYITITLPEVEFVRAFAQHILPARMHRVRFVGLFRAKGREERMRDCREQLQQAQATGALPPAASEPPQPAACEEPDPLEEGSRVLCRECRSDMQLVTKLDRPTSSWLLQAALLIATWLSKRATEDRNTALPGIIERLRAEATSSGDRMRWATLTAGDPFFAPDHFVALEVMIEQWLASRGSTEGIPSKESGARSSGGRGPPVVETAAVARPRVARLRRLQATPA